MKHIIDIENDENDRFDILADNVAKLEVYDEDGNNISKTSRITLFMSKNALLGLGTELIRLSYKYKEGRNYHIDPVIEDYMIQSLGIFLTPNSSEIVIGCCDMKVIDEYLKDEKDI